MRVLFNCVWCCTFFSAFYVLCPMLCTLHYCISFPFIFSLLWTPWMLAMHGYFCVVFFSQFLPLRYSVIEFPLCLLHGLSCSFWLAHRDLGKMQYRKSTTYRVLAHRSFFYEFNYHRLFCVLLFYFMRLLVLMKPCKIGYNVYVYGKTMEL